MFSEIFKGAPLIKDWLVKLKKYFTVKTFFVGTQK